MVFCRIFKESDNDQIYQAKVFKNEVAITAINKYLEKSENHLFVPTCRSTNWAPDGRAQV